MNDVNIAGMICEHIREEARGKVTLIGIYNDIVSVTKVPGQFAQLSFYVRIHLKRGYPVNDLTLIVYPIDGEPVELGAFEPEELKKAEAIDAADPSPFLGVVIQAAMGPVPIPKEGRMRVFVRLNGEEHLAATLKVRVRPPKEPAKETSSASEPLASQSPTASVES